eukprot:m.151066 g.151066  ORF g.151066 m.151066 type:complete len:318 (+) comp17848_c0_seq2:214-1167(+)
MASQRSAVSVMPASSSASETTVLRSRIEQQSDLIMMLKKHNDNMKQEKMQLEMEKKDAERNAKNAQDLLLVATTEKNTISSRFQTLAENHSQTVAFMEEHKAEVIRLRQQLKNTDQETERKVTEATNEINTCNDKIVSDLKAKIQVLEQGHASVESELQSLQVKLDASTNNASRSASNLLELQVKFNHLTKELAKAQESVQGNNHNLEVEVRSLQKNKEQLQGEMRKLNEQLRDVKNVAEKSMARVCTLEKENATLRRDLETQKSNASRTEVSKLTHPDEGSELKRLRLEYAAYKKHSTELLQREKEMNARLRHLKS